MVISHTYKFIFFSNPKTGSESVREVLSPHAEEEIVSYQEVNEMRPFYSHMSPLEVKREFESRGLNYDEYYRFIFIRNPFERLVSLYEMIYRHDLKRDLNRVKKALFGLNVLGALKYSMVAFLNMFRQEPVYKLSFKTWLSSTKTSGNGGAGKSTEFRAQQFGTYTLENYTHDKSGNNLVDDVIRLEDIEIEFSRILDRLSIDLTNNLLIKKNVRPRNKSIIEYYDTESIQLVCSRYKSELDMFNYAVPDL
jgi:hypothetical protein